MPSDRQIKLSVIMSAYNEARTIREVLEKVRAIKIDKEIIIVDDCSTDDTSKIVMEMGAPEIKLLRHQINKGKGAAIKTALAQVSGDIVIIQDADLEYDPEDYYKLIEPITSRKTEVVYGSRFLRNFWPKNMGFKYWLGNKVFTLLANILYGARITDEATCYKVFKVDILNTIDLKSRQFDFCPEFTAKVRKRGYKIYEVPISYIGRNFALGKKISWRDGLITIWTLIKYRFID